MVILTEQEAKCIYSQLTENDAVTLCLKTKIIMAVPLVYTVPNSFAKNLALNLRNLFENE